MSCFEAHIISSAIFERINNNSFKSNPYVSCDDLRYLTVRHYGFDHEPHQGEIICNKTIAYDILSIFENLYRAEYEIERVRLVDDYGSNDDLSMTDNNSSCFNYRTISGTDHLSRHAFGMAIDINPLYNPLIKTDAEGVTMVFPSAAKDYADRNKNFAHKINTSDLCYRLFTEHGFTWGGDWIRYKDYQHFEKE